MPIAEKIFFCRNRFLLRVQLFVRPQRRRRRRRRRRCRCLTLFVPLLNISIEISMKGIKSCLDMLEMRLIKTTIILLIVPKLCLFL